MPEIAWPTPDAKTKEALWATLPKPWVTVGVRMNDAEPDAKKLSTLVRAGENRIDTF
jgi:hypothetical protein